MEHILPVCVQSDCSISQIYVRDNNQVRFPEKNRDKDLRREEDFPSGIYCLFNSVMALLFLWSSNFLFRSTKYPLVSKLLIIISTGILIWWWLWIKGKRRMMEILEIGSSSFQWQCCSIASEKRAVQWKCVTQLFLRTTIQTTDSRSCSHIGDKRNTGGFFWYSWKCKWVIIIHRYDFQFK